MYMKSRHHGMQSNKGRENRAIAGVTTEDPDFDIFVGEAAVREAPWQG